MAAHTPSKISLPPRRVFGSASEESAVADDLESPTNLPQRTGLGRFSFSNSGQHRPSFSRWRGQADTEEAIPQSEERPPIPNALKTVDDSTTPLHTLSMIVLCITMLGEFLSANVSTPFVLKMVEGFGEFEEKSDISFWTGILVSAFFITQFLTSLLWATVAEKHGRRTVLVISLFGSAVTCCIFGTCTTLKEAFCIRLLQGVFAGAVGVARGSVSFITDASNEGRAYAILGFCWGLGGVTGAIIGGSFERPAKKWPTVFGDLTLFIDYPYLLPCAIAASVTLIGSILACFLSRDAGPREGAIQLPEKTDVQAGLGVDTIAEEPSPPSPIFEEEQPRGVVGSLRKKVSKRFSGYFGRDEASPRNPNDTGSPLSRENSVPMSFPDRSRTFSRTSRANGSAYGYTGSFRNRLASDATTTAGARRGSMASSVRPRRYTNHREGHRESTSGDGDLNFAQRLLMANAPAVTNIADLWVAAAMNVDNEDPFESDTEMASDEEDAQAIQEDTETELAENHPSRYTLAVPPPRRNSNSSGLRRPSSARRPSNSQLTPLRQANSGFSDNNTPTARRFSFVPAIFAHPGVRTPPAVVDAQQLFLRTADEENAPPAPETLAPIIESRRTSVIEQEYSSEKPPSLSSQLPWMIIIQYGIIALHTTTHDQIFMSYLVSDFKDGGLNLNAGHFAQLIALMCLAQIVYQFYLYPNIGPPRGRFSHLTMFRLGSALFIPSYLLVVLFRPFASAEDDGNFVLMTALSLATALRYCGITFAYTSIAILLNYMTPPDAVGYANGIAQSIVSLARFFGPIIGGYLWSVSTQDDPSGFPFGFIVCASVCGAAVLSSFLIR